MFTGFIFYLIYILFILIGEGLLCSVALVSVVQPHDSATRACISLSLEPPSFPPHPSGSSQSPELSTRALQPLPASSCFIHGACICQGCSLHWLPCVHRSVLHICVSRPALHAGSSVLFLHILCILGIFFFFLLEARIIKFTTPYLSYNFLKKLKSPI